MKIFVAFILLFISGTAYGFYSTTDSLRDVLNKTPQDTNRVLLLGALAERYLTFDPAQAKRFADEGLALAKKLHYQKGEILFVNHLSDYYYRQSDYVSAIEVGTQGLKIAHQMGDSLQMANSYRMLGNINTFGLSQYDQALTYHTKALNIYRQIKDSVHIAAEDGSISWIYAITHQHLQEALAMAAQGVGIAKALRNDRIVSYNYNSIGLIYSKLKQYDSALINMQLSNRYALLANDQAVIVYNKIILGDIYFGMKKYQEAINHYNESNTINKALSIRELLKESYRGLAQSYEATKQFEQAYKYYHSYTVLKDSLLNWETTQKTLIIEKQFEDQRKEDIIQQLENEKKIASREKQLYIIISAVGISGLLMILLLLARNSYQRTMANIQLQQKNDEIKTQNEELQQSKEEIASQRDVVEIQNRNLKTVNDTKDKLFSIIGHDLRGPIASLKSLLGLVAKEHVTVEELKTLTPKIIHNVGTLYEMMENLLHWSNSQMDGLSSSPTSVNPHDLSNDEIQLFIEAIREKKIIVSNLIPKDITAWADKDHVRIVLRNLINNAIKFTKEEGSVVINARPVGESIEITVVDNGIGIPAERLVTLFETNSHFSSQGTRGERGTGLGLLLCKELVEANGGRIEVKSQPDKGSTFYVYLKASSNEPRKM